MYSELRYNINVISKMDKRGIDTSLLLYVTQINADTVLSASWHGYNLGDRIMRTRVTEHREFGLPEKTRGVV